MERIRVVPSVARTGYDEVMGREAENRLRSSASLVKNEGDAAPSPEEMGALLAQVDELARFFTGLEPRHRVTGERLGTMA